LRCRCRVGIAAPQQPRRPRRTEPAIDPDPPRLIFCIDAGGSRSRGRLLGPDGDVRGEGEAGPCNPATDCAAAAASLAQLWHACAAAAGHDPVDRSSVTLALGGAGLGVAAARDGLLGAAPRFGRTVTLSDGYAALIGAGGGAPGALIIAGTGAVGHRLYDDGRSIMRDGWGWVGGDRGSGAWIGRRALRHALAAADGVIPQDRLAARVAAALRALSPLPRGWIPLMGPERLAALAPLVLDAAAEGDAAALAIRERAVTHLAALAGTLDPVPTVPLWLAGGLAAGLRPLLAARLGRLVAAPERDALAGCYLVATGRAPTERVAEEG
jgi:glucosamine kinase